ncbi:peptide/nickel transport system substrate-binding protein [Saccharopolyspora kobensis]|uniref:Peptide/nickel transport system substrate-binding protein n=1 Tax=Saccharopolyspora kobensis TaxID=146035 RepID=A0A1H5ZLW8_9PSEU|nr:ABC transporter substrate-binding protein [Saccharopolyspora kobensis]SEG37553.1 peptide/nickel transport system substrate-binding protein [Saccharopolyspora kobensis]SFF21596.1 peptide/nickel transport system substrate-binding protein [Saccharopolyspora kobensis]
MRPELSLPALSRRGFLGLTAAAVLSGCAGPGSTSAAGPPRPGGRLRAAFSGGGAAEVLDPQDSDLYVEIARAKALFDKLADFGSDMSPVPRLAERWEPSADLTTWRITLRQADFHDGRPVRAADVLASYARITEPGSSRRAKSTLSVIDLPNSREIDDRTVEFRLLRPYGEFPNALAALGAYVLPGGSVDFDHPIGTGPFRFASFEPGRTFLAARNPDHWDGAPLLDELEIVVTNDEAARVNALLGGQVEYAHDLTPASARTYESSGQVQVHRLPLSNFHGLAMKVDRPPFDRPELRQALFHLVDREELVRSVFQGSGQVCNDVYGKGYRYYADALPQRRQDLDRARALVRRAGAEGMTIGFDTSDASTGLKEAALAISDQAKAVGLNLEVRLGNKDTYWSDIAGNGVLAGYRSGGMPLESHFSQRLLTTSTTNNTGWRRPEFDARYHEAQSTTDEARRAELYREMQETLFHEGGFLWWGVSDWIVASAPGVHGIDDRAPANTLDWARFDKVWLA